MNRTAKLVLAVSAIGLLGVVIWLSVQHGVPPSPVVSTPQVVATPQPSAAPADTDSGDPLGGGILLVLVIAGIFVGGFVYMLPTVIAMSRNHHNSGTIAVVNLFLGWSFIGWVVALAWSAGSIDRSRQ